MHRPLSTPCTQGRKNWKQYLPKGLWVRLICVCVHVCVCVSLLWDNQKWHWSWLDELHHSMGLEDSRVFTPPRGREINHSPWVTFLPVRSFSLSSSPLLSLSLPLLSSLSLPCPISLFPPRFLSLSHSLSYSLSLSPTPPSLCFSPSFALSLPLLGQTGQWVRDRLSSVLLALGTFGMLHTAPPEPLWLLWGGEERGLQYPGGAPWDLKKSGRLHCLQQPELHGERGGLGRDWRLGMGIINRRSINWSLRISSMK